LLSAAVRFDATVVNLLVQIEDQTCLLKSPQSAGARSLPHPSSRDHSPLFMARLVVNDADGPAHRTGNFGISSDLWRRFRPTV
jgi:hypothetical protein